MGRYYSGDIEGKFWFGIQSSDDASYFGGEEYEPNHISYYFSKSDLPEIENGIKNCKKELGIYRKKLDKFFEKANGYTDKDLMYVLGISKSKYKELLEWYARLELGEKIYKKVKENGECSFDAET
jgi:hypothetical protein